MRRRLAALAVTVLAFSLDAHAGLRARYGGELVVAAPSAPVEFDPARAWSAVEVALAASLGAPVSALVESPPELVAANTVRLKISSQARWPDGRSIDAKALAVALDAALVRARVALPPLKMHADGQVLDITASAVAGPVMQLLDLPWLRLVKDGRGGAFRVRRGLIEADATAVGGAPMADTLRVENDDGQEASAPATGVVVGRPGPGGRAVVAFPKAQGEGEEAIQSVLSQLDRVSLVKLFVRGTAQVTTSKRAPPAPSQFAVPATTLVLAVDASERALIPVAQRLQVVMRDAGLAMRLVAEPREAHFARLARGEFNLALAALPPAPEPIQAATLLRLFAGDDAVQAFWSAPPDAAPLSAAVTAINATHLYTEGGGIEVGSRVRGVNASTPWGLDLSGAWLAVGAGVP